MDGLKSSISGNASAVLLTTALLVLIAIILSYFLFYYKAKCAATAKGKFNACTDRSSVGAANAETQALITVGATGFEPAEYGEGRFRRIVNAAS